MCTVCDHAQVDEIDAALAAGDLSLRMLEAQYGVSRSALSRHHRDHMLSPQPEAAESPGGWAALQADAQAALAAAQAKGSLPAINAALQTMVRVLQSKPPETAAAAVSAGDLPFPGPEQACAHCGRREPGKGLSDEQVESIKRRVLGITDEVLAAARPKAFSTPVPRAALPEPEPIDWDEVNESTPVELQSAHGVPIAQLAPVREKRPLPHPADARIGDAELLEFLGIDPLDRTEREAAARLSQNQRHLAGQYGVRPSEFYRWSLANPDLVRGG